MVTIWWGGLYIIANLPRVQHCIGDCTISECSKEVIVAVLREEVHGETVDSRKGKAVEAGEVEEPISTQNTVS